MSFLMFIILILSPQFIGGKTEASGQKLGDAYRPLTVNTTRIPLWISGFANTS